MPTDYHEIKRRYLQALELPPADRQQYLDMLDPAVKSEVSKLLSAEETASESFLAPVAGNLQQKLKSPGNEFDSWIRPNHRRWPIQNRKTYRPGRNGFSAQSD